jgi:hypothetical protein
MHANGLCRSPLPFGAILKELCEIRKQQKSEVPTIHAQKFVSERVTDGELALSADVLEAET